MQENPSPKHSWGSGLGGEVFREPMGWLVLSALWRSTSMWLESSVEHSGVPVTVTYKNKQTKGMFVLGD